MASSLNPALFPNYYTKPQSLLTIEQTPATDSDAYPGPQLSPVSYYIQALPYQGDKQSGRPNPYIKSKGGGLIPTGDNDTPIVALVESFQTQLFQAHRAKNIAFFDWRKVWLMQDFSPPPLLYAKTNEWVC